MKIRNYRYALAACGMLLTSNVNAASVSYSIAQIQESFAVEKDYVWFVNALAPAFDPRLGDLESVDVSVFYQFSGSATVYGSESGFPSLTDGDGAYLYDVLGVTGGLDAFISAGGYYDRDYATQVAKASFTSTILPVMNNHITDPSRLAGFQSGPIQTLAYFIGQPIFYGSNFDSYSGSQSGSISVTYNYTAAVPEPTSWILLVSGFGIIGGAVRNGRRRQSGLKALKYGV